MKMVKRRVENGVNLKETDQDEADDINCEADSKDTAMHIEMSERNK